MATERLSHLWRGILPYAHAYSFRLLSSNGPPVVFRSIRLELGSFFRYGSGFPFSSSSSRRREVQQLRQGLACIDLDLVGSGVLVYGLDPADAGDHGYSYGMSLANPLRSLAPGMGLDFLMGTYPQVGCFLGMSWGCAGLHAGAGVLDFASSDFATVANSSGLMWLIPESSGYYRKPPNLGSGDGDDSSKLPDYLHRYLSPASECYIKSQIGYKPYYLLPLGVVDADLYASHLQQACSERVVADGVSGSSGLPLFAPEILAYASLKAYADHGEMLRSAGAIPALVSVGSYAAAVSCHLQGVSMRFRASDASRFFVCDFVQTSPDLFGNNYYGSVPRYQRAYIHERLPLRDGYYHYHVGRVVVLSPDDLAYYVSRASVSHGVSYFKVPVVVEPKRGIDIPYLMASMRYLLSVHSYIRQLSRLSYVYRVDLESLRCH